MAKLTPHIMSEDARAQAEFYTHALGGEILSVITHAQHPDAQEEIKDKVMHLSLVAGGITFFMTDCMVEPLSRGNGMNLNLEFTTEAEARAARQASGRRYCQAPAAAGILGSIVRTGRG